MTYYRAHNNLTIGDKIVKAQTLSKLEKVDDKKLKFLLNHNFISIVNFPPVFEIPLLEPFFEDLEFLGVESLETFLDLCSYDLSWMLNIDNAIVDKLQTDVWRFFAPLDEGCKCNQNL